MAALGLTLQTSPALAQPALTSSTPAAVAPGKTIDLVLTGQKLDDPLQIWSSFPAKIDLVPLAEPKPGQTQRTVKVTLEAGVPVGIGGLMVSTPEGVSDPLLLLVDDLPTVADNGQNQSFAQAQEIPTLAAVDGVSDGSRFDYYKINVQSGQRVAVEVFAGRLGEAYDPVLRLLDANGKQLMLADDDPGLGSDCRFAHTFQAPGQYVLEVRDNQYRPGGRYRLRVGDFPLAISTFPLAGKAGTTAKFTFAGPGADAIPAVDVAVPNGVAGGRVTVGARYPNGQSSGFATAMLSTMPEAVEAEPNNEAAKANPIVVPGGISGRLETPGDRDVFSFDAKKGQRLGFKAGTRSFGSPVLLKMYIQKADGSVLAESAVSDADEETLVFTFPEDGSYRLAVQDLLKQGGVESVYRVGIEPVGSFSLALKPDKATRYKLLTAKNGSFSIDIPCARNGYDGPITLSVEGPGGDYQVFNNVIPEKQPQTKLIVVPPATFTPGQFTALKIIGKATIDGQEVSATVGTLDLIRVLRPNLLYPPTWMDGVIPMATAAEMAPFYEAKIDRPAVIIPRQTGQSEFIVQLERKQGEFKDPLQVYFVSPPAGFAFEVKRNGNGPSETYQVIVKGPKDMAEGKLNLNVLSFAEFQGRGQTVLASNLPLQIVTPLSITIAPVPNLVFGNVQKVRISAARMNTGNDADKQPIVVKWKKLPPGVTGPAEMTIPADQAFVDVDLTAAADAPAGKIEDLAVVATTKFQGQDLTVDSAPIAAEVKK
ncbi:MAG: hypothetical protein RIS70_2412 [Planctomycetota bacterium]